MQKINMKSTSQYARNITVLLRSAIASNKCTYATCPHAVEANSDATLNEDVKPYSEVPGPKPLPILGNTWR